MRLAIAALVVGAILLPNAHAVELSSQSDAAVRLQPMITVTTADGGCRLQIPPFSRGTFYVKARPPAGGLTGVEFRLEGLPAGSWFFTVEANPAASAVLGGLFGVWPGTNVAFPTCQGSSDDGVVIYTITAFNAGDTAPRTLRVQAHSSPSNPAFQCPLVVQCDNPVYTMQCATGGIFFLDTVTTCGWETTLSNPQPPDGAQDVPTSTTLNCTPAVPRHCLAVSAWYRLYLGLTPDPPLVGEPGFSPPFDPGPLAANTTYFWRVSQSQGCAAILGPVWSFTTSTLVGVEPGSWTRVKSLFR